MNDVNQYPAMVLWSNEDQAFIAMSMQLEGCYGDGSTPEEAIANLRTVIPEWIESAKQKGWAIPPPMDSLQMGEQTKQQMVAQREAFEKAVTMAVSRILELAKPQIEAEILKKLTEQPAGPYNALMKSRTAYWQIEDLVASR